MGNLEFNKILVLEYQYPRITNYKAFKLHANQSKRVSLSAATLFC